MTGSEENRVLRIEGLTASVGGINILHGIDLEIRQARSMP
jgi:Fe-S cluster assembly ATPase SufC